MNQKTIDLIIALLPAATEILFNIGGKIIKLNTENLTDQETIIKAFDAAKAEGWPVLTFK